MVSAESQPIPLQPIQPVLDLAIAATFTAEPLKATLDFWLEELGYRGSIDFAPYNQVFQELLDPTSLLASNRRGINIILIRLEDWTGVSVQDTDEKTLDERLTRNGDELINAVQTAMARTKTPLVIALCPDAPHTLANEATRTIFQRISAHILASLEGLPGLYLIGPDDFQHYPVDVYYDPQRDHLGRIPYTSLFFAALGTVLARRLHAITTTGYKVIVLDCDNTLWNGVVGEDGYAGIKISEPYQRLQRVMVEQSRKGVLLCLCSKNDEAGVLDVFEHRPDMILKRDHIVSSRINWLSKSQNIQSLAQELNLGLDSFIFLDDSPVECAEVRAGCPEVLVIRLPMESDIARFVEHIWPFDRLRTTSEDQQRTAMYKQELERTRFQKQAMTIGEFLAGLELRISISEPTAQQLSRVAQLTQRTNQFNFTTRRRSDADIARLSDSGLECRVVEVADRFGEYGLVGVMIFGAQDNYLAIDTFLLSCRVLGRGVEHRMLQELGVIARRRNLDAINATLIPTPKNLPARQFLDSVAHQFVQQIGEGMLYPLPTDVATELVYDPGSLSPPIADDSPARPAPTQRGNSAELKSRLYERIASVLTSADAVLAHVQSRNGRQRPRPDLDQPVVLPRTEVELALAEIWMEILNLARVGVEDNYFALGGTSLLAVDLFARIETSFGKKLPLTSLIRAPTVAELAQVISNTTQRETLVRLAEGGNAPPFFLIHDGDGETILYRNLAVRLKDERSVFGLQPLAMNNVPMVHTRIAEMAAYHVDTIRAVQPHGPYFVGGMCAGGVIAFEVAKQLQERGESVGLVAIIDAADPAAPPKAWHFAGQRLQSFSTAFRSDQRPPAHELALKALKKIKNLGIYLLQDRWIKARDEIRMRLFRFCIRRELPLPRALQQISVRTVYLFAEKNYRVDRPFEGRLLLCRATVGEGADEPYIARFSDPLLGWGPRASGGVDVVDIPGGHSSMLQEPNVDALADALRDRLQNSTSIRPLPEHPYTERAHAEAAVSTV